MQVLERLMAERVVVLSAAELAELLAAARVAREEETGTSGAIRVLEVSGETLVQEQTPQGELLVRRLPSSAEAGRLVDDRLATYERMWNGCGCRVEYFR